ncbi:hypothetical protein CYMTET_31172, partial [Cymbomonas tetramitiformis]
IRGLLVEAQDEACMQLVVEKGGTSSMFRMSTETLHRLAHRMQSEGHKAGGKWSRDLVNLFIQMSMVAWGSAYYMCGNIDKCKLLSMDEMEDLTDLAMRIAGMQFYPAYDGLPVWRMAYHMACTLACFAISPSTAARLVGDEDMDGFFDNDVDGDGEDDGTANLVEDSPFDALLQLTVPRFPEGFLRAAALTALAFLAKHSRGEAEGGDATMTGIWRRQMLMAGVFPTVIAAMGTECTNDHAREVVARSGAVCLLYLATEALDPLVQERMPMSAWTIVLLFGLLTSSESVEITRYIMVTIWILLRSHSMLEVMQAPVLLAEKRFADTFYQSVRQCRSAAEVRNVFQSTKKFKNILKNMMQPRPKESKGSRRGLQMLLKAMATIADLPKGDDCVDTLPGFDVHEDWWGLTCMIATADQWKPLCEEATLIPKRSARATQVRHCIKFFEFLVNSVSVYLLTDNQAIPSRRIDLSSSSKSKGSSQEKYWMVVVPPRDDTLAEQPLYVKALELFLWASSLQSQSEHSALVQLALQGLWNLSVRHRAMEMWMMQEGVGRLLLRILQAPGWPAGVTSTAAEFLAELMTEWHSVEAIGGSLKEVQTTAVQILIASPIPRLQASGLRMLGNMSCAAPLSCPKPAITLRTSKRSIASAGFIGIVTKLIRFNWECIAKDYSCERCATPRADGDMAYDPDPPAGDSQPGPGKPEEGELDLPHSDEIGCEALVTHSLKVLRNLSVDSDLQVEMAKHMLDPLLTMSSFLASTLGAERVDQTPWRVQLQFTIHDLSNCILKNLAMHPGNRTRFYRLELQGSATKPLQQHPSEVERGSTPPLHNMRSSLDSALDFNTSHPSRPIHPPPFPPPIGASVAATVSPPPCVGRRGTSLGKARDVQLRAGSAPDNVMRLSRQPRRSVHKGCPTIWERRGEGAEVKPEDPCTRAVLRYLHPASFTERCPGNDAKADGTRAIVSPVQVKDGSKGGRRKAGAKKAVTQHHPRSKTPQQQDAHSALKQLEAQLHDDLSTQAISRALGHDEMHAAGLHHLTENTTPSLVSPFRGPQSHHP